MAKILSKVYLVIISLGILLSCNPATQNSNTLPQDFLDALHKKTNDSISKNKSHIDSEVFADSVLQIINEMIDPPQ